MQIVLPSSRREALSSGQMYYFTGAPCMKGHSAKRYAMNSTCVECSAVSQKAIYAKYPNRKSKHDRSYRAAHSERIRASKKAYSEKNKDKIAARSKQWRIDNAAKLRGYQRQYSRKHLPAPTRPIPTACECCGGPPVPNAFHLDHCHVTNEFRGWLCMKCNTGIAKLGDDLAGVLLAVDYLRRASPANVPTVNP